MHQGRQQPSGPHQRQVIHSACVVDADTVCAQPGALLIEAGHVLAAGRPEEVGHCGSAEIVDMRETVLVPALVNAHTHLDLTNIGPIPFAGSFADWANTVRQQRPRDDVDIRASVARGIALCTAGGTALVGDIAGDWSLSPLRALRDSHMQGVSYLEIFGIGGRQQSAIRRVREVLDDIARVAQGVHLGIQPHAPYSAGPDLYRACAALGLPLSTHLAETLDEIEFVRDGSGELAAMLEMIGVLDDSVRGLGRHPIEVFTESMVARPTVVAHVNYCDDSHIEQLAHAAVTVAYCPRASEYFGHPAAGHPPHRYRDMLRAGVNVAIGTDSILCLDTPDRISVLDDLRLLSRRDDTDARTLLAMATTHGAVALGYSPDAFRFAHGCRAGVLAIPLGDAAGAHDPLANALRAEMPPQWIIEPHPDLEWVG